MLDLAVNLGLLTLIFALIYKMIPRVHVSWRDVWTGAAVTSLLFTVGKFLIGLYLGKSDVTSGFGAAGSLVILMVWVYYSAQIFLSGRSLRGSMPTPLARDAMSRSRKHKLNLHRRAFPCVAAIDKQMGREAHRKQIWAQPATRCRKPLMVPRRFPSCARLRLCARTYPKDAIRRAPPRPVAR